MVIRDGKLWIPKTREQWMEETGLSLHQYRRAREVLVNMALIEVRVMQYGPEFLVQSHIHLLLENLKAKLQA